MQHNLLIVAPGSREVVAELGAGLGGDGPQLNFVPQTDQVLFHTRILRPGETQTISFTALEQVQLRDSGFAITFTRPIDPPSASEIEAFLVERFRYYYQEPYGSPQVDKASVVVNDIRVAADGRSLEMALEQMVPGFIYALDFSRVNGARG